MNKKVPDKTLSSHCLIHHLSHAHTPFSNINYIIYQHDSEIHLHHHQVYSLSDCPEYTYLKLLCISNIFIISLGSYHLYCDGKMANHHDGRDIGIRTSRSDEKPLPLDLSHHYSYVAKNRLPNSLKRYYKFFQIPGIGNLAGGLSHLSCPFLTRSSCLRSQNVSDVVVYREPIRMNMT